MGIKFVGIRKSVTGQITHVLINNGDLVPINVAIQLAREGEVDSITDIHSDGSWEISNSTGTGTYLKEHNLDILPEV